MTAETSLLAWPALPLILGSLVAWRLPRTLRSVLLLALPAATILIVLRLPDGDLLTLPLLGHELVLLRVDALSRVFALVFQIAALLAIIYTLYLRKALEPCIGLFYAGCATGVVFAGDLWTHFFFWELAAISSLFLVWARGTDRANRAGTRYFIAQMISGVLLVAGIAALSVSGSSLRFEALGEIGLSLDRLGPTLIFLAFGLKAAFPFLHTWLIDTYPESTPGGTVFLSAFTTKFAIYSLARGFAGEDLLIWIGVTMAAFPIFFAVIENDLRRVLAYSMTNQLGFMVVAVGIGTEMALNGAAAHAFADIIFKGLLFMSMGAVLHRVGHVDGSHLGGLYKSMPQTTVFCIVGAASISAFPLFSAFATKSLIMEAAAHEHMFAVWLVLLFASAGVFHHAGIKIPFFAFFAHDSGIRCEEAPLPMRIAMGLSAILCIGIGVFPGVLYQLLPFGVDYQVYTTTHVVTQLQLLFFSALAFATLMRTGLYPPELRKVNLDSDWLVRGLGYRLAVSTATGLTLLVDATRRGVGGLLGGGAGFLERHLGPQGVLGRSWTTASMVFWVAILLGASLVLFYANT